MFSPSRHGPVSAHGRWLAAVIFAASLALIPRAAHADPAITNLNVTQGSLGGYIIIYGTGFGDTQGQSYVTFGDQQVPVIAWSNVAIYVSLSGLNTAPITVGNAYPLVVHVQPANTVSSPVQFTLVAPPPPADTGTGSTTGTTTGTATGTSSSTGTGTSTGGSTGTTSPGTTSPSAADVLTLNDALLVEQTASQFYSLNAGKAYLTATSATNPGTTTPNPTVPENPTAAPGDATDTNLTALKSMVDEMNAAHSAHVASLQQAIGASAPAAPAFQNLDAPTLDQFLTMAQSLEDFAVGAHQGVVLSILQGTAISQPAGSTATGTPPDLFSTETAILADDARFAGGIRAYRKVAGTAGGGDPNTTITENGTPLNVARTHAQVLAFVQPFLATSSTPGTTTPGTGTGSTGTGGTVDNGTGGTTPDTGNTGMGTGGTTTPAP